MNINNKGGTENDIGREKACGLRDTSMMCIAYVDKSEWVFCYLTHSHCVIIFRPITNSTTMIGYDSDRGEMLFADFPERLIGSAVSCLYVVQQRMNTHYELFAGWDSCNAMVYQRKSCGYDLVSDNRKELRTIGERAMDLLYRGDNPLRPDVVNMGVWEDRSVQSYVTIP